MSFSARMLYPISSIISAMNLEHMHLSSVHKLILPFVQFHIPSVQLSPAHFRVGMHKLLVHINYLAHINITSVDLKKRLFHRLNQS